MKILLIDYDAGTTSLGGDTHAYDMAREWKKNGGKTLIVTADYSYLRQKNPEKPHIGQIDEGHSVPVDPISSRYRQGEKNFARCAAF